MDASPQLESRDRIGLLPPFTRVLARRPAPNFHEGITTRESLGTPDAASTYVQFDAYLDALRECDLAVTVLDADPRFPDGHFVEDPAVIFGDTAFICLPARQSRKGEQEAIAEVLSGLNRIYATPEVAIEGGDVLFCHDRVLIGLSNRTSRLGAEQLTAAIKATLGNVPVEFVPFKNVLHLKTGLTELAPGILLHDPAMVLQTEIDFAKVITLPAEEGYAASVLPINGRTVLIADGFPTVRALAEEHYSQVIALNMSEIEKMDGGLTCLSLRY